MEGNSFVAPGHLPLKWNYYGPPGQPPPGYQPRKEASWMTPEIHNELQNRNRLQEVSQNTGNPKDRQAYQAQCEKVQNMINKSKSSLGLSSGYNSGYSPYTGPNSNGVGFGPGPHENQYPANSQGMPIADPRAAYYRNNTNYYSQRDRKLLSCGPCNRTFYNKQRLDEHLKEHVECPFPECKLSAHVKIIDQHINNQHMLVNFANLQIDDETWIAERKKRFPTSHRAELRRAEQMEKLKRGEKLGRNKSAFKKDKGKYNKSKTVVQRKCRDNETNRGDRKEPAKCFSMIPPHDAPKEERGKGKFRQKKVRRWEKPSPPPKAFIEVDLFDSDDEVKDGLNAFSGTKQFYESTGEVSYFGNKNLDLIDLDDDMEMLKDADIDISDDEEWHTVNKEKDTSLGTLVLGGALGSLMGAYSDSEEENEDLPVSSQNNEKLETLPLDSVIDNSSQNLDKGEEKDENKLNLAQNNNIAVKRRARRRPRHQKGAKGPVVPKRFPFPKRRKTLLEKLLQPDIIHERNVILQCIRYVVENNFFDDNIINNSECVEVKDNVKKVCGQGIIDGGKIEPSEEGKKIGETFGKSEVREKVIREERKTEVEEEGRNIEEIREESKRSEALVDIDSKSKTDVCVSDCVDNDKTVIKRNSSSISVPEDDGGYESDKEVVSKKLKNEECAGDSEIIICKGTDTLSRDNKEMVDMSNENMVGDNVTIDNEARAILDK